MHPLLGERTVVVVADYGILSTEINHEGYTFLHCDVYKWSGEIYKDMQDKFVEYLATNKFKDDVVLMAVDKEDKKIQRFAKMFGFVFADNIDEYNVYILKVK